MGYSQHAGMVIVADGTFEAEVRLRRVLTSDPFGGEELRDHHVRAETAAQPPEGRLRYPSHRSQVQGNVGPNRVRKPGHAHNLQRAVTVSNVKV